jgi:hypothetical protein
MTQRTKRQSSRRRDSVKGDFLVQIAGFLAVPGRIAVSTELRRTHVVLDIFKSLVADGGGTDGLRAGDICTRLREIGLPMDTWQVRGELSNLEANGSLIVDSHTGAWFLVEPTDTEAPLKDTA